MTFRITSVSILPLVLFTAAALHGQTAPANTARPGQASTTSAGGIVHGTVKDNTGAVIPDATVTIVDQNGVAKTTQSKPDGTYQFRGVAPGTYTISAEADGLTQDGVVAVTAAMGKSIAGDITMKPAELKEEVNVEADSTTQISVDPSQNATALVLKKEDLDALPDDPDDLQQDLQALAGPSAGPGGGQVYIDGFSSGRFPPKESIREIRINQNPFSSEFDKLGFGRIEILTKPGSDKFHGSAFYDVSDGVLNARNPFLTVTPDFRSQRFGGNVSGPVTKHGSFFIDAERRDIDDNGILNATELSPTGDIFNNRSFVPTPQYRTTISPRLDWQLGANHTLSLRYSYLDNDRTLWNVAGLKLPDNGYGYNEREHNARITETSILSPKAVNETRLQYSREYLGNIAVSNAPQVTVQGAFTSGGSTVGNTTQSADNYEAQNLTTLSLGKHSVKFGARIRAGKLYYITPSNFNGSFVFGCLVPELCTQDIPTAYSLGQPQQFTISAGNPYFGLSQIDVGTFIQDDWRLASNFTLSAGLRWEGQTNIHDWRDWAPRIGIAWSPFSSGKSGRAKTVIRGGFGMFYQRFDAENVLSAEQKNGVNQQTYIVKNPDFYPIVPALSTLQASANQQIRYEIDRNLRAPYLVQTAIGVEQQLFSRTTLSVNYTNTRGVHQYRTRDINAPLTASLSGPRPYGNVGDIYLYESSGLLKQNQLMVRMNTQIGKRVSLFGAYIWNNAHSDTDGLTSLPVNQYNTDAEWGRSSLSIEHRTFIGGSVRGPLRLQFSPFITARSGIPFNITTGTDNNNDGIVNDRPALATGPGLNIIGPTPYGFFNLSPSPGSVLLPRNFAVGPTQVTFNVRLSRTWGFGTTKFAGVVGGAGSRGFGGGGGRRGGGPGGFGGDAVTEHRYNLTLSIGARNLFNHVNYDTPIGFLSSPTRLEPINITGGFGAEQTPTNNRRIDLQLRFQF